MSSINSIQSSSAWSNLNAANSTSTDNSSASELIAKLKESTNGTSGGGSSEKDGDSKTSIERSVARGEDGSMIVTITLITTSADGSKSSKVISKTKLGSSADNLGQQAGQGASLLNAQSQELVGKNGVTSSYAGNQYEQNSLLGAYVSGVSSLKEEC
ncbi:hypothetical protein [Anaerosinus massiliensis]|uniref:hypothetical protein n=1 Tax=Massilibacillus massiliensis TaxID=1806837 RepID=UPI000DA60539|nr:hypothetical protein [Massilibacillus massiliensis]